MELRLRVTPTRAPVPLGASAYDGKITCFGQADTYSYFQTGMTMAGTLRWGGIEEAVAGDAGHIDRQWFPSYAAAGGPGGDPRSRSHEWRTINLDNGVDLSIWRQFDRTDHNVLQPFSGATTSHADPDARPECAEDIEVSIAGYVRWPESIHTLVPPPSQARYLPDRHRLTSRSARSRPDGRAAGAGARARLADRLHGGPVPLPRHAAGKAGERLRILRANPCNAPGLGIGRRAGDHCGEPGRRRSSCRW